MAARVDVAAVALRIVAGLSAFAQAVQRHLAEPRDQEHDQRRRHPNSACALPLTVPVRCMIFCTIGVRIGFQANMGRIVSPVVAHCYRIRADDQAQKCELITDCRPQL